MSKVKIQGNASGTGIFTVAAPATNTDRTITLPDVNATVLTTAGGTVTGALEVQASWRLGTNTGGSGSGAPYAGGVGGGFNPNNNIYSMYFRDRTDSYWNDAWLEAKTLTIKSGNASYNTIYCDASGRALIANQPSFLTVGMNTDIFNANTGSSSYLYSGTPRHNIGSCYNGSNGRFTAPVAGRYLLFAGVLVNSGSGRLEGNLAINGSGYMNFNGTGSTYDGPTIISILQLNANDYVTVQRQSGTAYGNGHGNHYFGGHLLG